MAEKLMTRILRSLGLVAETPRMSPEQDAVAERQRRIEARQKAIDIQVEVLQAERREQLR